MTTYDNEYIKRCHVVKPLFMRFFRLCDKYDNDYNDIIKEIKDEEMKKK